MKYPDEPDSPGNRRITIRVLFDDKKDDHNVKKNDEKHTDVPTENKSHQTVPTENKSHH